MATYTDSFVYIVNISAFSLFGLEKSINEILAVLNIFRFANYFECYCKFLYVKLS